MIVQVLRALFVPVWELFCTVDYPGIGIPVVSVMVGFMIIRLSIDLWQFVSGIGSGRESAGRASAAPRRKRR